MPEEEIPPTAERVVVVVGAGFRGTSVLERLAANTEQFRPPGGRLRLVSVDEHPPGPGRIWRTDQSAALLMNTPASAFTVWLDASVNADGPKVAGPGLWEWQRQVAAALTGTEKTDGGTGETRGAGEARGTGDTGGTGRAVVSRALAADLARRPELAAHVKAATADSCTPRVLLGHYLTWCHETVVASLPEGVRHDWWRDHVTDIQPTGARYRVTLGSGAAPLLADAVVLCTGWSTAAHGRGPATHRPAGRQASGAPTGVRRLRGDNASDQLLAEAKPGADVVVEGLGLSFFDVATLLTVGRGGRFVPDDTTPHGLRYEPSGSEPLLHATSRHGVPYRGRPGTAVPDGDSRHRFLREALLGRPRPGRFDEVGPAIARDTLWDYYTHLAAVRPDALTVPPARLREALTVLEPDSAEWRDTLSAAVPDPEHRLDLDSDAALARREWDGQEAFEGAVRDRLLSDLAETDRGAASSLKVAHRSFGKARGLLVAAVEDGGLTAESYFGSYAHFVDLAFRLNNGPPPVRLRQLLALHDAGVVRFLGPRATPDDRPDATGHARWRSPAVPGAGVRADLVIEARVPAPDLRTGTDPLLRALRHRGLADVFHLESADGPVPTAAPRAEPLTGRLLAPAATTSAGTTAGAGTAGTGAAYAGAADAGTEARGADPELYALGVLMRDTRVSSLAAPAPGADAVALRETDRTARSVLAGLWSGSPQDQDAVPSEPYGKGTRTRTTAGTGARTAVISAEALLEERERGRPLVLLEIGREPEDAIAASERLPGAHYVALSTELAGTPHPGSGRYPLPSTEDLQRQTRRWGIDEDSLVVVHTRAEPQLATRAWWTLTWAGVPDVRYLDGGVDAWLEAGGPLGGGEPADGDGRFTVRTGSLPTLDADGAARLARSGTLLDARPVTAYTGEKGGGHIPGALNLPAAAHIGADGRLRGTDELRERYAALGVTEGTHVGVYCGGGVAATLDLLALSTLGIPAALYPGSWSEWSADPSRPVRSGGEPG